MHLRRSLVVLAVGASALFGQLTVEQKLSDFQYMSGVYAKRYGPYEWKRDVIKFDLFDIAPWLEKVRGTKNDLEFYDVMARYVAGLNDAHDVLSIPSNFVARLNFTVDIYDGKPLVDSINRTRLPTAEFPFLTGYEVVSIDGVAAGALLDSLEVYQVAANDRSTRRFAATLLTVRPQSLIANAPDTPDSSAVVLRRPDGGLETYNIPWTKSGLPLTSIGRFPGPSGTALRRGRHSAGEDPSPPDFVPAPGKLRKPRVFKIPNKEILGFGAVTPVFAASLPSNFVQRLGKSSSDVLYSGVFEAGGYQLGFIRIPDFAPDDLSGALVSFATEIAYFQENTDGLIVDVMRNPGGYGDYTNALLSLLIPYRWRSIGFEVRATSEWVQEISYEVEYARAMGVDPDTLDRLLAIKDEIVSANHAMRGRTKPIPLDDVTIERDPLLDDAGNPMAYSKPLMVLIDECSASAAEIFAGTIQDNARGALFGWRTMGAGGNVEDWNAGSYSGAIVSVTESLMNRKDPVVTPGYPDAPYVENIGVHPDLSNDYMTVDNLTSRGKPFVDGFIAAMVEGIRKAQ